LKLCGFLEADAIGHQRLAKRALVAKPAVNKRMCQGYELQGARAVVLVKNHYPAATPKPAGDKQSPREHLHTTFPKGAMSGKHEFSRALGRRAQRAS